jgi:hypothetical protein
MTFTQEEKYRRNRSALEFAVKNISLEGMGPGEIEDLSPRIRRKAAGPGEDQPDNEPGARRASWKVSTRKPGG